MTWEKRYDQFNESDIEDPDLAQAFLLFYLFETWEKLLQVSAFVHSWEHRRIRKNQVVINSFADALNQLAKQLDDSAVTYCQRLVSGEEIVLVDYVQAVIAVKDALRALLSLHQKLHLLGGSVEDRILYAFVSKLVLDSVGDLPPQGSWLSDIPLIEFTENYNFIEYHLPGLLFSELQESEIEFLSPRDRNVVLALPKAEAENPLMWAILAHEIAHTIISSHEILEEIVAHTKEYERADELSRQVYRNWSLEFCADLMALRLLGPSYFFSFASMALLLDLPIITLDHPAIVDRISIMARVLATRHPEWIVKCPDTERILFTRQNLVPFFMDLASYKLALWSLPRYRREFQPQGADFVLEDARLRPKIELIVDVLDRIHAPMTELSSPEQLVHSLKRLSTGQFVASQSAAEFDKEQFRLALATVESLEEIKRLLPPPEKPLTLSTILTCGWMLKIYSHYTGLLEAMAAEDSLLKIARSYRDILSQRSELLQRSLSHAFMVQTYWSMKRDQR